MAWVSMGHIGGVYGIRGWLRVVSGTAPREALLDYDPLYLHLDDQWQAFHLEAGQAHGKGLLLKFAGCDDRNRAVQLVGCEIAIQREQLPDPAPGEYYWADLKGLRVITLDSVELGVVAELLETGANDVLVVRGDRERLIPFLQDSVINEVCLEQGIIRVDWDPDF